MSGNFRSSENICKAIVMLRAADSRNIVDEPLGDFKHEPTHVCFISYAGKSVHAAIGAKFAELVNNLNIEIGDAPVVKAKKDLTFRLAEAVSDFHFAFEAGNQKSAIEDVHKIILEVEGRLSGKSYHQCLIAYEIKPDEWRPQVLHILRALRYDPDIYADADAWHGRAKELFAPYLPADGPSIGQKLKKNKDIAGVLVAAPAACPAGKNHPLGERYGVSCRLRRDGRSNSKRRPGLSRNRRACEERRNSTGALRRGVESAAPLSNRDTKEPIRAIRGARSKDWRSGDYCQHLIACNLLVTKLEK